MQAHAKAITRAMKNAKPMPLNLRTIAEYADVGLRRTQVILYMLADASIVRHVRKGYVLDLSDLPSADRIAGMLTQYEERAEQDKQRLADMMHYAETAGCRMQIIRQYFAEESGPPCGRCDNCERSLARMEPTCTSHTGTRSRVHRKPKRTTPLDAGSIPSMAVKDAQGTTVIPTAHGSIRTTVPETIVHSEREKFRVGDRVVHNRFGLGEIRDVHGNKAVVRFVRKGERKLVTDFLEASGQ
jgi:superfamily II DNA helicase RecQ